MSAENVCRRLSNYHSALAAYNAYSEEERVGVQWWKTEMPDIIKRSSTATPFRVLAVGPGNGKPFDEELLNMLCSSQKPVVYTVVEPERSCIDELQELVKNKYSSVEFRWFCSTWQDFQDKEWKNDGSHYNLIHFLQCAYYISESVEELRERMKKCYDEMLGAGGVIVITASNLKGKWCFLPSVTEAFWWNFKVNIITKIAQEENWKVDADELTHQVDLSACFDQDSVQGNLMLDFLAQKYNYRQSVEEEELEKNLKFLEDLTDDSLNIVYPCILDITKVWKEPLSS